MWLVGSQEFYENLTWRADMKFTRQNLDEAIKQIFPGSDAWKVDTVTLIRMAVEELYCFPERYSHLTEYAELIRIALIQIKQSGWMTFEVDLNESQTQQFKVGDKVVRCNDLSFWREQGYSDDDVLVVNCVQDDATDDSMCMRLILDGTNTGWWVAKNFKKI